MTGAELAASLAARRFDFFTGVPCSLVESLIVALERDPVRPYVPAVREDVAVGLAAGAYFGGRRPVVVMQNSGLGTSLNALASLTLMYRLPLLLIVTWRGYGGKDAPEHILTGEITPALLDLLRIPHRVLTSGGEEDALPWAAEEIAAHSAPVALVVPPGVVELSPRHGTAARIAREPAVAPSPASLASRAEPLVATMSRRDAIEAVMGDLGDEAVVHANGFICRESFAMRDRGENFYMIGSMGLASSIGLGLAMTAPDRRVVVLDGDGNLLMAMGALAMVATARPRRFVHVVFDNEVYGSTGNQASLSAGVRLDRVAAAAGYRTSVAVTTRAEVVDVVRRGLTTDGPHFVLVKVTTEEHEVPRIPHTPEAMRDRFRRALGTAT
jgi:phosphonopyruvate decarboxylase